MQFPNLPASPFGDAGQGAFAPDSSGVNLPAPPPHKASLFDKDHRRDSLLAIGTGLLSGFNFTDGLAAAGQNLQAQRQLVRDENRGGKREFGGPDNAFEIVTDPRTGQRTVSAVPQFQAYLQQKRIKPKDVADMNGRAMYALQQLPPEQREAAYAHIRANPSQYGVDADTMPTSYDPVYADMAGRMGMTVSQALTRQQATDNAQATKDYRADVQADRETRTGIYRDRAAATTAQGNARLAQGQERIAISKAKGAGGGGGGSKRKPKLNTNNNDLSYLLK